jgi:ceramide glucosyltransferase
MSTLAAISGTLACVGIVFVLAGWAAVLRFSRRPAPAGPLDPPAVTVLKPLYGDEPLLEDALATVFRQAYPRFQIVFGVQDPDDPALAVVERLRARFPSVPVDVVVDPARHGRNRKVGNLMNMLRAARHDVLVIADSDVHVPPDWLERLTAALFQPGVGLATALYTGLPARPAAVTRLGVTQITHGLLPGALLARALGRQDCFGASMALRRETLAHIGGLRMLVDRLADDNVLGRLVSAANLNVALASVLPATTVPEARFSALWSHELRWARTTRALEPVGFAGSVVQYPIAWATLAVVASGGAVWALGLFVLAWAVRALAVMGIDSLLGLAIRSPLWLLPLRDLLSVVVLATSFTGDKVEWRGHVLAADNGRDDPDLGAFDTEEEVRLLR